MEFKLHRPLGLTLHDHGARYDAFALGKI